MKKFLNKITEAFTFLIGKVGNYKKKASSSENDAIMLPHQPQNGLMEDYEIAAYHNQA